MKYTFNVIIIIMLAGFILAPASHASLFLSSWGVSYGNWEPVSPTAPANLVYNVEDWTGDPATGYLDPGFGGDEYDVEAVYAGFDSDYVFLAIVTGFPVDTDAGGALRRNKLVWENPSFGGNRIWGGASDPLRVTSWSQTLAPVNWSYSPFHEHYAIEVIMDTPPVPEPASLGLLCLGLAGSGFIRRLRRKK